MPQTWTTCGTQGSPGVSYTYDLAGVRNSKTVTTTSGTITYNYLTQNGQVVRQTWTDLGNVSHVMDFIYDNNGKPYAFYYDGTLYYYITNLQGDVIRIIDTAGATICTYTYDAWGRLLNSSTNQIFKANPIRYRGYYYDAESGLYYLGSRYYDPQVKRFINADGAALATINPYSDGLTDKNYFAYCDNNPTSRSDDGGQFWDIVGSAVVGGIWGGLSAAVSGGDVGASIVMGAVSGAATAAIKKPIVGAVVGAITSVISYGATSSAPNLGGAIVAGVSGAVSGAIGGAVGKALKNANRKASIGASAVKYVSSLATNTLSAIGTTGFDTYKARKSGNLNNSKYNNYYRKITRFAKHTFSKWYRSLTRYTRTATS